MVWILPFGRHWIYQHYVSSARLHQMCIHHSLLPPFVASGTKACFSFFFSSLLLPLGDEPGAITDLIVENNQVSWTEPDRRGPGDLMYTLEAMWVCYAFFHSYSSCDWLKSVDRIQLTFAHEWPHPKSPLGQLCSAVFPIVPPSIELQMSKDITRL